MGEDARGGESCGVVACCGVGLEGAERGVAGLLGGEFGPLVGGPVDSFEVGLGVWRFEQVEELGEGDVVAPGDAYEGEG